MLGLTLGAQTSIVMGSLEGFVALAEDALSGDDKEDGHGLLRLWRDFGFSA